MKLSDFAINQFINGNFIVDFDTSIYADDSIRKSADIDLNNLHDYVSTAGDYLYDQILSYEYKRPKAKNKYLIIDNFELYLDLKTKYNVRFIPFYCSVYRLNMTEVNTTDILWLYPHDNVVFTDDELGHIYDVFDKNVVNVVNKKSSIYITKEIEKNPVNTKMCDFLINVTNDKETIYLNNITKYPNLDKINLTLSNLHLQLGAGDATVIYFEEDKYGKSMVLFLSKIFNSPILNNSVTFTVDPNILYDIDEINTKLLLCYDVDYFDNCKTTEEALDTFLKFKNL